MRLSTEREFEISTERAECFEPSAAHLRDIGVSSPEPLVASNNVSAAESALILAEPKVRTNQDFPVKPNLAWPSTSRVVDVIIAATLFIVLLPLMAIIVIFMKLSEHGPVFFAQPRVGLGGKPFNCLKFRTMHVDADLRLTRLSAQNEELRREWTSTQKLLRDPRATRFGRILRNTSLDELPQLINVLRGEMSLVGPRPIIENEMSRYGRYAALYVSVRPGLTGLWQVTRNSGTSYRRRVATDVLYVRNRTLAFDFRILLATIPAVLMGNG